MVRSIAELPWRRRVPSLLNKDHPIPILSVGDFHEASTIQYLFVWGLVESREEFWMTWWGVLFCWIRHVSKLLHPLSLHEQPGWNAPFLFSKISLLHIFQILHPLKKSKLFWGWILGLTKLRCWKNWNKATSGCGNSGISPKEKNQISLATLQDTNMCWTVSISAPQTWHKL